MNKSFVLAEVKTVEDESPSGAFEAVVSAPTLDRDGEIVDKGAFDPLPASIPMHAYHDFTNPIGRGTPFYDGDILKVRGAFASTPRAQEIRTLVNEGVIGSMSVGFREATRDTKSDAIHITTAELLEASFVSIPANRETAVLMAKEYEEKIGARNSAKDRERLQSAHDLFVELGAACSGTTRAAPTASIEVTAELGDEEKSTTTDPEVAAAPAAAPLADVNVALAQAQAAEAEVSLL